MMAVIRIATVYAWLHEFVPFVRRRRYAALLDVASGHLETTVRLQRRMRELESVHTQDTKLLTQCQQRHEADLKTVEELNLRCCRQAQLLRQMRDLTEQAALSMNHIAELS